MAYIDVIEEAAAKSPLKDIYEEVIKKRGKLSNVIRIQSLNPEAMTRHLDLYMTIMYGESPLKRYQREMMAVVVSVANNCDYCHTHHGAALNHFWKDPDKVAQLKMDHTSIGLDIIDQNLCKMAWNVTKDPGATTEDKFVAPLREAGLEDRAILDAMQVISYFNFVNRMVLGLGVHLDPDAGEGYLYD